MAFVILLYILLLLDCSLYASNMARCFSLLSIAAQVIFFCYPDLRRRAVTCFLVCTDQTLIRKSQSMVSI